MSTKLTSLGIPQVSDNTDSRLLVGLYRCTELPGQFVWEPGLLTRALTRGAWLLIEDAERAQHDVLALLEPLTRGGGIIVPSLGGLVMPEPGFQLFLTQRMGEGCAKEELSKLARSVKVKPLADLELREVVSKRFPSLANLTEKILRMFSILTQPHQIQSMGASEQARLVNCLRQSRKVTVRDVLRWCARGEQVANSVEVSQLSSLLYQVNTQQRNQSNKANQSFRINILQRDIVHFQYLNLGQKYSSHFKTKKHKSRFQAHSEIKLRNIGNFSGCCGLLL